MAGIFLVVVIGISMLRPPLGCLFLEATGVPCPACGLTRSVYAFLRLRVGEALSLHLFGPPLILLLGMTAGLGLSSRATEHLAASVRGRPRACAAIVATVSMSFLIYCVARGFWTWAGNPGPW